MYSIKRSLLAALALAAGAAQATTVPVTGDGSWYTFDVDSFLATSTGVEWIDITDGSTLTFSFTVPAGFTATLTVVDAGFAGDRFNLFNGATLLGNTSAVPVGDFASAANVGLDFNAALANADFSRATFTLNPGSYAIGGSLTQSVTFGGSPLNATAGGLSVTLVPEPATVLSLLAGLGVIGAAVRRRRNG